MCRGDGGSALIRQGEGEGVGTRARPLAFAAGQFAVQPGQAKLRPPWPLGKPAGFMNVWRHRRLSERAI